MTLLVWLLAGALFFTGCDEDSTSRTAPTERVAPPAIEFFGVDEDYPEREVPPAWSDEPAVAIPEPDALVAMALGLAIVARRLRI